MLNKALSVKWKTAIDYYVELLAFGNKKRYKRNMMLQIIL